MDKVEKMAFAVYSPSGNILPGDEAQGVVDTLLAGLDHAIGLVHNRVQDKEQQERQKPWTEGGEKKKQDGAASNQPDQELKAALPGCQGAPGMPCGMDFAQAAVDLFVSTMLHQRKGEQGQCQEKLDRTRMQCGCPRTRRCGCSCIYHAQGMALFR